MTQLVDSDGLRVVGNRFFVTFQIVVAYGTVANQIRDQLDYSFITTFGFGQFGYALDQAVRALTGELSDEARVTCCFPDLAGPYGFLRVRKSTKISISHEALLSVW